MKLALLIFGLFVAVTAETSTGIRHKRQFELIMCAQSCQQKLQELNLDGEDEANGGQIMLTSVQSLLNMDKEAFNTYCTNVIEAKTCLDGCGSHPMLTLMGDSLKPFMYMCQERREDFNRLLPCSQAAQDEINKTCTEEQCPQPAIETAGPNLGSMCITIKCLIICSGPIIMKNCDGNKEAAQLLRDMTSNMLNSTISIMGTGSQMGPQAGNQDSESSSMTVPANCQALIDGDWTRDVGTSVTVEASAESGGGGSESGGETGTGAESGANPTATSAFDPETTTQSASGLVSNVFVVGFVLTIRSCF